jgi:hypothetical protein
MPLFWVLVLFLVPARGCFSGGNALVDFDGDGSLDDVDCASADAAIYPGAPDPYDDGNAPGTPSLVFGLRPARTLP